MGHGQALASSPAAWAEASRQAASECRFWMGHRGLTVVRQLPLDGSGRMFDPTAEGFLTLWLVRQGSGTPQRLECRTRRPDLRSPAS
ncbi:MAG: hypothetical protein VKN13_04790 [Cyanobacteriota bacterium]|nr:hypothetical protein [Cyanobacteriota bacterium]